MSLRKYHSVSEMPRPTDGGNSSLPVRIRELWRRAFLLSPPRYKKGVRRFRSIEEADAARAADRAEYMRRTRQQGPGS
jgi:hypothetical protein